MDFVEKTPEEIIAEEFSIIEPVQLMFQNKFLISVPRSGQHMTEHALEKYHELLGIEYSYCDFYACCGQIPCKKKKTIYQKNHDFDIVGGEGIIINDTDQYLFLYRDNLLQQIEAHFRWYLYDNKLFNNSNIKIDFLDEKNMKMFKKYCKENIEYYKKIYKKWIIEKPNILPIEFDDYLLNFSDRFKKILEFFNIPINEEFIQQTKEFIHPEINKKIDENDPYYTELNEFIHLLLEDKYVEPIQEPIQESLDINNMLLLQQNMLLQQKNMILMQKNMILMQKNLSKKYP
jgi:hypothetical protein